MATLNGGITAIQELIRVTGTPPEPGSYLKVDSEAIRFMGATRGAQGRSFTRDYWAVDRGVAGTTKATHVNGATLTQYYPDAELSGGSGLPSQWTDGGHGDVTATVDQANRTPLSVQGINNASVDTLAVTHGTVKATKLDASLVQWTAVTSGSAGNNIAVAASQNFPGPQPLSITVVGSTITVFVATDVNNDQTSTVAQVLAAVAANGSASALVTAVATGPTNVLWAPPNFLKDGRDAGDALNVASNGDVTVGEGFEINPGPTSLYGLHVVIPAGFDDVANGRFVVTAPDGTDLFLLDSSGIDMRQSPGGSAQVIRLLETDTGARTDITSHDLSIQGTAGVFFRATQLVGLAIARNAAPADGDINVSECAFWFDDTNGASKLQIKGKTADGTVVTGVVNLA